MQAMSPVLPILLLGLASAVLPPVPPLPTTSWPAPQSAEPFARELWRTVKPGDLSDTLAADPERIPAILRNLGTALMSNDAALSQEVSKYVGSLAGAFARNPKTDVPLLASIVFVDPLRYVED